jgi:hypothetical protein
MSWVQAMLKAAMDERGRIPTFMDTGKIYGDRIQIHVIAGKGFECYCLAPLSMFKDFPVVENDNYHARASWEHPGTDIEVIADCNTFHRLSKKREVRNTGSSRKGKAAAGGSSYSPYDPHREPADGERIIKWRGWTPGLFVNWPSDDIESVDQLKSGRKYEEMTCTAFIERWPRAVVLARGIWYDNDKRPTPPKLSINGDPEHPDIEIVRQIAREIQDRCGWVVYK